MRIDLRRLWKAGPRRQGKVKTSRARALRRNVTDAERRLWRMLRGQRLAGLKFRRQVPYGPYYLDFYCASHRVAIELDATGPRTVSGWFCRGLSEVFSERGAGQHYFGKGAVHDILRDRYLRGTGLKVLRYSDRDLLLNPNGVAEDILQKTPYPDSLPNGHLSLKKRGRRSDVCVAERG